MQWDGVHVLVQRAKTGEERAWQELHTLVRPYLVRSAQRLLGPDWPHESVSDLLQSTWLRAWQGLECFRGGTNDAETGALLRAWLGRTLKNVRCNDRRFAEAACRRLPAGSRRMSASGGDSTSSTYRAELPGEQPTPSANVRANERQSLIQDALNELSDAKDREIIRLRFFQELSLAQIAKQLGWSYDDIRDRFHRSLRRLESKLKGLQ